MEFVPPAYVSLEFIRGVFLRRDLDPDNQEDLDTMGGGLVFTQRAFDNLLWSILGTLAVRAQYGMYGDPGRLWLTRGAGLSAEFAGILRSRRVLPEGPVEQEAELDALATELRRMLSENSTLAYPERHPIRNLVLEGGDVIAVLNPIPPDEQPRPGFVKATVVE